VTLRIVFVMDSVSTIIVDEDTTFALMLEAQARGHRVDHCTPADVGFEGGSVVATVRSATMRRDAASPVTLGHSERVALADVDVVMVRKDPPFDPPYLWLTLLLEHLRGKTLVVNDPRGLRECNEHLHILHFPEVIAPTLLAADKARIRQFVADVGGTAVLKPVDGHGGDKVFLLREGDLNVNAIIESLTHNGSRCVMAQAYLPEVRAGDKRILLIDGEPLGAILRVPADDDARSNIHVGGTVKATALDDADQRIVEAVAPRLREEGLWFVGLDVIGGRLTEINVTSPTGIQQMTRLSGENLPGRVIGWIEARLG
jgi:glutathione synthase